MSTLDLTKLFEQAQQLQRRLAEAQGDLAKRTVTAEAGGGLVSVTANGLLEVVAIKLDPICVDSRDVKMLEDLVLLATNKALREARALAERELGGLAGLRP
jgi:DNA-binding YbaB/EbfC family protein